MKMGDAAIIRSTEDVRAGRVAWREWLGSPPGRYVLDWQQQQFDLVLADVFGFHALQCGLPQLDALRDNRMPHRIRACEPCDLPLQGGASVVVGQFEELPFASQSIDLVVLPHVLEFACDPHQVLREVDRVLRPEGRVMVSGFNPVSLWGARQWLTRGVSRRPFLPREGHFIGLPRLRDWLELLGFEFDRGRYGCYRPPCRTQQWLDRTHFMESAGDRWWPICGALYIVSGIKRVRGMRLIGPVWRPAHAPRAPAAAVSPRCESGREA